MFHIFSPDTLGLVTLKLGGGGGGGGGIFFLADLVNLEYGILFFDTFSDILQLSRDQPVVSGGRNQSTRQNPTPNPKSLVTYAKKWALLVLNFPNIGKHFLQSTFDIQIKTTFKK